MRAEKERLAAELEGLKAKLAESASTIEQLTAKLSGEESKMEELASALEKARSEAASFAEQAKKVAALEQQISELKGAMEAKENALKAAEENAASLKEKVAELEQKVSQLEAEAKTAQELKAALEQKKGELDQLKTRISELEANLKECAEMKLKALDADKDGIPNESDLCPNTPEGVQVDKLGCGPDQVILLKGVNFAFGTSELTDEAKRILDGVADILKRYPELKLEVAGHTDNIGDRQNNIRLSQARANAVKEYLVERGISPDRLVAKGYGPDQPIADNSTRAGRAANRRVELRKIQ